MRWALSELRRNQWHKCGREENGEGGGFFLGFGGSWSVLESSGQNWATSFGEDFSFGDVVAAEMLASTNLSRRCDRPNNLQSFGFCIDS